MFRFVIFFVFFFIRPGSPFTPSPTRGKTKFDEHRFPSMCLSSLATYLWVIGHLAVVKFALVIATAEN